jgi:DNA-binding response OmpR family regulator
MKHILLVEDDTIAREVVLDYLKSYGYSIHTAASLKEGRMKLSKQTMDLILLDVSLPDGEGFDLASELRKKSVRTHIIFMTSHTGIEDMRKGFETGARDYIKKPFDMEELGLRVRCILGDFSNCSGSERTIGAYTFNPTSQKLQHGDDYVILGRLQAVILDELSFKMGAVVSKNELLEKYWDGVTYFSSRNLDSVIVKLRERFKKDPSVHFLALKREGYRLVII